eukprot:1057960-Prymnesium_polylepis.1
MPEGFGVSGCVLLLLKALEGIKQGANLWYELNRGAGAQARRQELDHRGELLPRRGRRLQNWRLRRRCHGRLPP